MNLKTLGLMVATAVISIAISSLLFPSDRSTTGGAIGKPNSVSSVDRLSASKMKAAAEESDSEEAGDLPAPFAEPDSNKLEYDENQDPERYLIGSSSLYADRLIELQDHDSFNDLVEQLREQTSSIAIEKRMSYELLFYSQALIRDGSVTLDTLECGSRLCVAELRANRSTLDQFIGSFTSSSHFGGGTVAELPGYADFAGDIESRRLVFAHDSTIDGITLP